MNHATLAVVLIILSACATKYHEVTGTCIVQEWQLLSLVLRTRQICELPTPEAGEELSEKEPISPYPDFIDSRNKADTMEPELLEDTMHPDEDEDQE